MTTTTYSGECPKCHTEHRREWKGEPWRGSDGETSFAADCHACGPGVELEMFPEEPEDANELVEGSGVDLSVTETTMIVEREGRSVTDTITLSREALTSALREAAAKGMDDTSGPSSGYAASCREVADEIIEAIEAGRFVADDYVGYVDVERRAAS